ncbi:MAG: DUF2911 domain-containing protein [Acidobacteria bacterium]|nr:DUF2911 domain-containing protein [Acidobacteriota bacterium]
MSRRHVQVLSLAAALAFAGCGGGTGSESAAGAEGEAATGGNALPILALDDVKPSQSGLVWQEVANTQIEVTYDRPVARGRDLFGGIVPFGEIWNPGANDATAIGFTRDVTINGNALPAGRYSLWAIPDPNRWTIIFNRQADVYHTPYPGEEDDALRFMASPRRGAHMETLAFYFAAVEKKDAELRLHWGETYVPFSITVP